MERTGIDPETGEVLDFERLSEEDLQARLEDAKHPDHEAAVEEFERREREEAELAAQGLDERDELLNMIQRRGGLIVPGKATTLAAELRDIQQGVTKGQALRLFRKDGKSLDVMAETLREDGFDLLTPDDLLQAIDESLRGRKQFPTFGGTAEQNQARFARRKAESAGGLIARIAELVRIAREEPRKRKQQFVDLGPVSKDIAKRIKEASGFDVSGFIHVVPEDLIRKNKKIENNKKAQEDLGIEAPTTEDYLKLPELLSDPDFIGEGEKTIEGFNTVVLSKRFNGNFLVAEEVRRGRKKLGVRRFFRQPADKGPLPAPRATSQEGFAHTSETIREQDTSNVAQEEPDVKAGDENVRRQTEGEAEFRRAEPARAAEEVQARAAQWRRNFERIAPGAARAFRLEFGDPEVLVERGLARREDLTGQEEAAYAAAERIIYLFDEGLRRNTDAVSRLNLQHEMAHAYWDMLDGETRFALQKLWKEEIDNRTGPLFEEGEKRPHVALGIESDVREWFAERMAHANDRWAKRRMALNTDADEKSLENGISR